MSSSCLVFNHKGHWDFGTYSGDYEQDVKGPLTIAFEFNPRAGDEIPNIVDKSKISVSTREAYEVLKIMAQEALRKTHILRRLRSPKTNDLKWPQVPLPMVHWSNQ